MGWLSKIETGYNLLDKNYKMGVIGFTFIFTFFVWYSVVSNLSASIGKSKTNIAQVGAEVTTLKKQISVLKTQAFGSRKLQYQKEENNLKKELVEVNKQISSFRYQLVSRKEAFFNLKNMLSMDKNVKLISIQYLPVELVKDTISQPVFRTPIELTLQGTFPDILIYLRQAEKENTFIFWDEMEYKVTDYPLATVKLKIHVVTSEAEKNNVKV